VRAGRSGLQLLLLVGLVLAAAPSRATAQFGLVELPITDQAYDQLGALERMGCTPARVSSFRPYQVRAIRAALLAARADQHCQGSILDALTARFAPKPRDTNGGLRGGAEVTAQGTALAKGEFLPMWDNVRPKNEGTPTAVGIVHGRLSYGDGADDHVVVVADGYAESNGRNDPTDRADGFRHTAAVVDFSEAYVNARAGIVSFSLGREQEAWLGEGTNSLILSANGPPIDRLAVEFHTAHWEGRAIVGELDKDVLSAAQDSLNSTVQPQDYYRFLYGHALTWRPDRFIEATLGETALISSGSNTLDLYYVNPFVPYIVTKSDTGRKTDAANDNLTAFVGMRIRPGPFTLRGELLIDDIQIDSKDRPNIPDQLGWQLGASTPLPIGVPASLDLSYERIDSYTYQAQFYNQVWQHYNVPIGSSLGPDADLWEADAEAFLFRKIRVAGGVGYWRRGLLRIDDRPGDNVVGAGAPPFPTSAPGKPVQTAELGSFSVQYLNPVLPLTLRANVANIKNVNNTPSAAALYAQLQVLLTYAFRYP
jgi:Capsule assembly protein Wzi